MTDPTIASWSRESDLLFQLRQLREENERLRTALAQPVQEPETFERWNAKQHGDPEEIGFLQALRIAYCAGQDSVTTPPAPQRPWVGLTEEEMSDIVADIDVDFGDLLWKVVCLTKIIEAKLKEKNK